MEDGFKNLLIGFVLISLFGVLILTAVVEVGEDYNMDTSKIVGGATNLDGFKNSIASVNTSSQEMKKSFEKGSIWSIGGVVVEGIFDLTKQMFTMIYTPFSLVSGILEESFGVPKYVTTVISGLLILSIIFAVWRLLKIGD